MRTIRVGGVRALAVAIVVAIQGGCGDEPLASWVDQFGTAQNDSCMGVSVRGRDLYAFGRTGAALPDQTNVGGQDVYLRKYDVDGTHIWTRQFGTTGLDDCFAGNVEAGKDQVIVGGGVTGALPGQTWAGALDAFLRAYDSDGNVLWTHQFGTSAQDAVRNVVLDGHGDIYIAAQTAGALPGQTSAGDRDAVVGKFDSEGNLVWLVQFGSSAVDEAIGVTLHGHSVYATGITRGTLPDQSSSGDTDGFVIKLDAEDGAVEWLSQFGSAGADSPWKVRVIGDGIFVSGHTTGSWGAENLGELDLFLTRVAPDGEVEWVRQFGTTGNDLSFAMTFHAGGIAMAGTVRGALPGQTYGGEADFFVRHYDSDGVESWTLQWGTSVTDALTAVASHGEDLYVSGASAASLDGHTNAGLQDAVVIRIGAEDRESALE